ncbi:hypothetical protein RZS08_02910, partial [Arthrospira platensis SPKY1]|nr:hypothetical protein [Arthrospira platensis SPKY1]
EALLDAFAECDGVTDKPSVVFAYTIKGWGLPIAGNPRNHSALLTGEQIDALRIEVDVTPEHEWDRFDPASPEGILAAERREILHRDPAVKSLPITVPHATGISGSRPISTQEAFGRVL